MSKTQTFTIRGVRQEDVPEIADLCRDSFLADRQTQMKNLGKEPFDMHKHTMDSLPDLLRHPRCVVRKAVDDETGEIMGYCNFALRGFAYSEIPQVEGREVPPDRPVVPLDTSRDLDVALPADADPVKRLEDLTGRDMERWMREMCPDGVKCLSLVGLSVSPKWQGRGAGAALLKWGTDLCDEHGVFAWCHSSEPAWKMYEKSGFEVIRSLDLDLDAYAPCPPPNEPAGSKWGHYVFRYMQYFGKKEV